MTRERLKKRRQELAAAMGKWKSVRRVAEEFDVSPALVRRACREFGVTLPTTKDFTKLKSPKLTRDHVLSDLRSGKSPKDLARHYNVSEDNIASLQAAVVQGGGTQAIKRPRGSRA